MGCRYVFKLSYEAWRFHVKALTPWFWYLGKIIKHPSPNIGTDAFFRGATHFSFAFGLISRLVAYINKKTFHP
jgi:hypothetical protein